MAKSEILFGTHTSQSFIQHYPEQVLELFIVKGADAQRFSVVIDDARALGISVQLCTKKTLDDLTNGQNHQGVVLKVRPVPSKNEQDLENLFTTRNPLLLLVLDGVTDPQNLGAILRTADAAGVDAVITTRDKAVGITPSVRRVASGAAETVTFIQVGNLARSLNAIKAAGVWVIGTAGEATSSIFQHDLSGHIALVMGAEGKGLRRLTRDSCDHLVNLPMAGSVSSLNVSVAAGICLFECVRQRLGFTTAG